jgi:CheY-like chemotaxis protein
MEMTQILLIEDNPGDIFLVQRALEEHLIPHRLHVVRDGGEAFAYLARMDQSGGTPCPHVLLIDLNLPKAEGAEVLAAFRKHPACAQTPVIVLSSSDAPRDRTQMAALGFSRYFKKPSSLDAFLQLGAVVREVIEGL